jgi:hypothetical protein
MNTTSASPGVCKFAIAIADTPLATANAAGSFDVDSLQLNVDKINLALLCDPSLSQQIPPQELAIIRQYQLAGQVSIQGSGMVRFQSIGASTFAASLDLRKGHCRIPGWIGDITPSQCSITASRQTGPTQFTVAMRDDQQTAAITGSIDLNTLLLDLAKVDLSIQCDPKNPITPLPAALADSLAKLKTGGQLTLRGSARIPLQNPDRLWCNASVSLKNGQCQPPGWTSPVKPAKFEITASNLPDATRDLPPGNWPESLPDRPATPHVWLANFSAESGNQILKLDGGELLFNPTDDSWIIRRLRGAADVGDGPGPLEGDNARIYLPFIAAGDNALGLRIELDDATVSLTPNHVHINRINGLVTVTSNGLRAADLSATCAQGQIQSNFNLNWHSSQPNTSLIYGGEIHFKKIDLHQLAVEYTTDLAARQQAFGQLDLNLNCHGSIPRTAPSYVNDTTAGRVIGGGDFDISNGHFANIPVLKDVVAAMHNPGDSMVGEAAARFKIANQVVKFTRAGASSPAIGIQGSGTLGFDQKVNMVFVATPLADWSKDVKGAWNLGDAGAAIFGKVQDVVNGIQRAIYQFRVTGEISNPTVATVPVPFLSDQFITMFQQMAGNRGQGSVAEGLKKQQGDSSDK